VTVLEKIDRLENSASVRLGHTDASVKLEAYLRFRHHGDGLGRERMRYDAERYSDRRTKDDYKPEFTPVGSGSVNVPRCHSRISYTRFEQVACRNGIAYRSKEVVLRSLLQW
jgi:hypothetical protein